MKRHLLTVALVSMAVVGIVAFAPSAAQAQMPPSPGNGSTVVIPSFPTYYFTPPVMYGWDPIARLPYYGYMGYYPPINQAYYSTYVPSYLLPPAQRSAYNYWARSTYLPWYYSYYNNYRPGVYFYGSYY